MKVLLVFTLMCLLGANLDALAAEKANETSKTDPTTPSASHTNDTTINVTVSSAITRAASGETGTTITPGKTSTSITPGKTSTTTTSGKITAIPTAATPESNATITSTTTVKEQPPAVSHGFDAGSFVGGIVLCAAVVAVIYFGCKAFKSKKPDYSTL